MFLLLPSSTMADKPTTLVFKAEAFKGDKKFMFTAIKCQVGQTFHLSICSTTPTLQNLPDSDGGFNTNDTYLRIRVVGNPTKKTPTIKGSLNPVFKEDNSYIFTGGVGTWVEVICMDWDPMSKDDIVIKVHTQIIRLSNCQYFFCRGPSS